MKKLLTIAYELFIILILGMLIGGAFFRGGKAVAKAYFQ